MAAWWDNLFGGPTAPPVQPGGQQLGVTNPELAGQRGVTPAAPPPATAQGGGWQPQELSPAMGALLHAGLGMLAQPRNQRLGQSMGAGLLSGMQSLQYLKNQQKQDREYTRQLAKDKKADEKEAKREAAIAASVKGKPADQAAFATAFPDAYGTAQAKAMFDPEPVKAPEIKDFYEGGTIVQKAFNPTTGGWEVMGSGPRFAPTQPRQGPEPSQLAKLIRERNALAPDDPNRPFYDAIIGKETTRGGGITIAPDGTVQIGGDTPKPPMGYEPDPDKPGALRPIAGGPGEKGGEQGGKLALLPGAQTDIGAVRKALIEAPGNPNRAAIAAMNNPAPFVGGGAVPGTQGTGTRAQFDAALDTMVRLRTGAAATPEELDSMRGMYMPNVTDPANVVEEKLARLERDLAAAESELSRGSGGPRSRQAPVAAPAAPPAQAAPVQIQGDADYNALPSGTPFVGPDGKQRVKP